MIDDSTPTGFLAGAADVAWLSGEDHLPFLERMSTNRLADLVPGAGRATAVLNDTGRVVDWVRCYAAAAGTALVSSGPGGATAVASHLRSYILFRDRVRVTDASSQVLLLRLVGREAADVATRVTGLALTGQGAADWVEGETGGATAWLLRRLAPGGPEGVDVVVPVGEPAVAMLDRLRAAGVAALDSEAYACLRIAHLLPAFGAEIDGRANPLELGLRPVVDFEKGCYIGQEVVARLDTYQKVQRHLVRLGGRVPLAPGAIVHLVDPPAASHAHATDEPPGAESTPPAPRRALGRITTAAQGRGGCGTRALALVPTGWAVGQRLVTASGDEAEIEAAAARPYSK